MKKNLKLLIAGIVAVVLLSIYCIWQNEDVGVSNYEYVSEKIGKDLDGYRIVHVSDLHNKEFGKNSKRLVSMIEKQKPDIIVISGDLIDSRRTDIESALGFVSQITKIAPVYYVTGNHEERFEPDMLAYVLSSLEELGVTVLENESVAVYKDEESFVLYGLKEGTIEYGIEVDGFSETNKLKVMLAHKPHHFEEYHGMGADLVLSGHAHGGQVRIPFVGGVFAPDQFFFPKYTSGMHEYNGMTVVISRGLGNSRCPIRVNNRPELVVLTLKSKDM